MSDPRLESSQVYGGSAWSNPKDHPAENYYEENPDDYICDCGAEKAWDDEKCPVCLAKERIENDTDNQT